MNQAQKRRFLIEYLLKEQPHDSVYRIPDDAAQQKKLLRALLNVRMPAPVSESFTAVQDAYLRQAIAEKGITDFASFTPLQPDLYLWRGDITTLRCDAIVNAANSGMTGCYQPCHSCIDNCIHTYAGIELRNCCAELMRAQGYAEPTGQAKITPAFNLPSRYVIHTVGPVVDGRLTQRHCDLLASCYTSCLTCAEENDCKSIAFCCISTGVFGFPQQRAAQIAVDAVRAYKEKNHSEIKVIFNVFKDEDDKLYRQLLSVGA